MKTTLSTIEAATILAEDEYSSFTLHGAVALVDHLEQIEEDTGVEIEMDPIAIRSDYTEYQDLTEWAEDYFGSPAPYTDLGFQDQVDFTDDSGRNEAIDNCYRKYIDERGTLLEFKGGIIVEVF